MFDLWIVVHSNFPVGNKAWHLSISLWYPSILMLCRVVDHWIPPQSYETYNFIKNHRYKYSLKDGYACLVEDWFFSVPLVYLLM